MRARLERAYTLKVPNMSDELQNDGFEIDAAPEVQEVEVKETTEIPEAGSELAPEVSEDEKKAKRQAAFNKEYGAKKQAERDRDAALKEVADLKQAQLNTNIPQAVGEMPDSLDFDTDAEFTQAKTQYINNIRAHANHDAQQASIEQQRQQNIAAQQQKAYEAQQASITKYSENAKTLGVDPQELKLAANAVASYGISSDLTMAILSESNGPLITKYLAANPQEVSNLNSMTAYQAGAYMATLSEKASALKPKPSSAPSPTTDISGTGADPETGKYNYISGSTIDVGSDWT